MFTWGDLRGIGESWPSRVSILVPFIGSFIVFNENISSTLMGSIAFFGVSDPVYAESRSRLDLKTLYVFYVGLVLFSIASTIYQLAASKIIKKYDSPEDYVISQRDSVTVDYLLITIQILKSSNISEKRKDELGIEVAEEVLHQSDPVSMEARKTVDIILKTRYEVESLQYPILRFIAALFYACSFCFLIFPSLRTFYQAAKIILFG